MKRISLILVLLLTFSMLATPVLTPAVLASDTADGEAPPGGAGTDLPILADADDPGGKGDPGGAGDGLGADGEPDPMLAPGDELDGQFEALGILERYVVWIMYLVSMDL